MPAKTLAELVDIFKCCIFNWGAFSTILPAFIIAGAIIAFVPSYTISKNLGSGSKKYISYPTAALTGAILPACSCNIVPLFASIIDRGAGIGPAFTFLYAGPAINLISTILTFKVIGPILGIWRLVGVLLISVTLGLIIEMLFPGEKSFATHPQVNLQIPKVKKFRLFALFVILFSILIIGSSLSTPGPADIINKSGISLKKIVILFLLTILLVALMIVKFKKFELLDWLKQTFKLIKTIVPLFIISILIIGLIAKYINIHWIHNLLSAQKDALGNRLFLPTLRSTFFATILGELMYFPILSEVAFTKAFLKLGMDVGPAIAILLAGPGTSLPGFILISRFVGWRKVGVYLIVSILLELAFGTFLAMSMGDYICACLGLK